MQKEKKHSVCKHVALKQLFFCVNKDLFLT